MRGLIIRAGRVLVPMDSDERRPVSGERTECGAATRRVGAHFHMPLVTKSGKAECLAEAC